ncbi:GNAT family N-acetyltransferase [Streptomyces sp. NPDC047022]|uniref:GNAT family N-acetyltransferase n=1 Tax=Streptomyces sp. NPDC047022 TaxID=3155737 RepID=UPI0033D7D21B
MSHVIRPVRPEEWPAVRELRLTSLQDPVAHLAFLDTYDAAVARPDSFWRERAEGASEAAAEAHQFVAETADGTWAGTLTVLMEKAGTTDWAGFSVDRTQGHVVGVYVRPSHRGTGLLKELLDAGLEWAWGQGAERVRLIVHEDNARAAASYRKAGFAPSGVTVPLSGHTEESELEMVIER